MRRLQRQNFLSKSVDNSRQKVYIIDVNKTQGAKRQKGRKSYVFKNKEGKTIARYIEKYGKLQVITN